MNNGNTIISISLIEDNRYVRFGMEELINSIPEFSLTGSFENCEKAFETSAIEESDVVLMDIGLPGMSGIEGVKYISKKYPDVIVLMCTIHSDDQKIFDAICAGAVGYLLKEISADELIKAIKDSRSGGSPMSPNIARKVISFFQKSRTSSADKMNELTEREIHVLKKMSEGKSYSLIANELFLSIDGVRYHIRHIYEKLHVNSRGEAVAKGLKNGLIFPQT
ncbi:MAG: response regulator transcription factor [Bacteroidota bacterium]|nr:response regulator transcription factor [Bacteroidota bacterium]